MEQNGVGPTALADGEQAGHGAERLRAVFGTFATGVVAVTALDKRRGRPTGIAANSFASVSLAPPLLSFCVARTSTSWPRLRIADRLCVNILGAHQQHVSERFAAKGEDKAVGLDWFPAPGGAPVVAGSLGWLECSVEQEHPAGDHVIVVARVRALGGPRTGDPLVFFRSGYGRFTSDHD
ncbi:flavin reductase family protein [Streptomyces sp. NPDC007983]|uniref:flavin reductase family protein n=1 Tax=Streptomyces sp. NPDC007983 TaxID=3364800 RepID=UPI0036F0AF63